MAADISKFQDKKQGPSHNTSFFKQQRMVGGLVSQKNQCLQDAAGKKVQQFDKMKVKITGDLKSAQKMM